MKAALESHGSIKGCRVAVAEVDTTRQKKKQTKIPGISILNNFHCEKSASACGKLLTSGLDVLSLSMISQLFHKEKQD